MCMTPHETSVETGLMPRPLLDQLAGELQRREAVVDVAVRTPRGCSRSDMLLACKAGQDWRGPISLLVDVRVLMPIQLLLVKAKTLCYVYWKHKLQRKLVHCLLEFCQDGFAGLKAA